MLEVVVVLLVLHWEVSLTAQGAQSQQARSSARHRGDAGRLQARGMRWQLDRGSVSSMGEVLRLELLLLQVDRETRQTNRGRVGRREDARRHSAETQQRRYYTFMHLLLARIREQSALAAISIAGRSGISPQIPAGTSSKSNCKEINPSTH